MTIGAQGAKSIAVGGGVSGIVSIGDGAVIVQGGTVAAQSAYRRKVVMRIAPDSLDGRDEELAKMAEFCAQAGAPCYLWWRADAWAGKSALLSWFVLHPPPGVRLISFFITGRISRDNDRQAFTEVVLEQLAEMLDEPSPIYFPELTREAHLLDLLDRAAARCQARQETLALVIDGLDEDADAGSHSIAALLPAIVPPGLRVILAGRSNPPVPHDVPDGHPLRDPDTVRLLARSPHAAVAQRDAERELSRLLDGSQEEKAVLGMTAASGGGLSCDDLADLTNLPFRSVKVLLAASASRTFQRRPAQWRPNTDLYLLGHEELQRHALAEIDGRLLRDYQNRIHGWADRYRAQGWPPDTPEYLLLGYFALLKSGVSDKGTLDYALDGGRQRRILAVTGGHAVALAEIAEAQRAISGHDDNDLLSLARLAIRRDDLLWRSTNIPAALPAIWAELGNPVRGEALAESVVKAEDRSEAFLNLADAFVRGNNQERAIAALTKAESASRLIADPYKRAKAYAALATASEDAGDRDRADAMLNVAEGLAHASSDSHWQDTPGELESILEGAEETGAKSVRFLMRERAKDSAVVSVAATYARMGDYAKAAEIAAGITGVDEASHAAEILTAELIRSGEHERAARLAESIARPWYRIMAFCRLTQAFMETGDLAEAGAWAQRSEALVHLLHARDSHRVLAYAVLADAMSEIGDRDRALALLNDGEAAAAQNEGDQFFLHQLALVAEGLECNEQAARIRRLVTDPERKLSDLVDDAFAHARAGRLDRAVDMAQRAEMLARSMEEPKRKVELLDEIGDSLAQDGHRHVADQLFQRADTLAEKVAESTYLRRTPHNRRNDDGGRIASWLAQREAIVASIPSLGDRARALIGLAESALLAADGQRAARVTAWAKETIDKVSDSGEQRELRREMRQRTEPARARMLAAAALRDKSLKESLPLLAKIDPALIIATLDDLAPGQAEH